MFLSLGFVIESTGQSLPNVVFIWQSTLYTVKKKKKKSEDWIPWAFDLLLQQHWADRSSKVNVQLCWPTCKLSSHWVNPLAFLAQCYLFWLAATLLYPKKELFLTTLWQSCFPVPYGSFLPSLLTSSSQAYIFFKPRNTCCLFSKASVHGSLWNCWARFLELGSLHFSAVKVACFGLRTVMWISSPVFRLWSTLI